MPFWEQKRFYIFALIFALLAAFLFRPAKQTTLYTNAETQREMSRAGKGMRGFFQFFIDARNFQKENELLKLKIDGLLAKQAQCENLEKENKELRGALDLGLEKSFNLISSRVLSKDLAQDKIYIDKGEKDGAVAGLAVVTGNNVLVGKINKVFEKYSEIELITHPKNIFNAQIVGKGIQVVLKGVGKGKIALEFLSQDKEKDLAEGDALASIALGGAFPEGFLVGKVVSIEKKDIDPVPKVEVAPDMDLPSLDYLFLVSGK